MDAGEVSIKVVRQTHGSGRRRRMSWGVGFRVWLKANEGGYGRIPSERAPEKGGASPDAFLAGLARGRFAFGLAAAGINAAITKSLGGLLAAPRERWHPPVSNAGDIP